MLEADITEVAEANWLSNLKRGDERPDMQNSAPRGATREQVAKENQKAAGGALPHKCAEPVETRKEVAKERQREGGKNKVPQNSAEAGETREQVATLAGVSRDTVGKYESIAAAHDAGEVDDATMAKVDAGPRFILGVYDTLGNDATRETAKRTAGDVN